jgi:hypothetical protein
MEKTPEEREEKSGISSEYWKAMRVGKRSSRRENVLFCNGAASTTGSGRTFC